MTAERVDIVPVSGLNPEIGLLLAMLDASTQEWRSHLEGTSDAAVLWQPFPNAHSIGVLLLHMADVEAFWLHEVGAGQPLSEAELARFLTNETQQYDISWPTPPVQPLAWFLAQHDEVRARTRQLVSAWDDPDQSRPLEGKEFTQRWLLHHVLTHEAYHGGQAVLLSICTSGKKAFVRAGLSEWRWPDVFDVPCRGIFGRSGGLP